MTGLEIFAACCLAWGLGCTVLIAALDGRHRIAHLLTLLHHHGGPRA